MIAFVIGMSQLRRKKRLENDYHFTHIFYGVPIQRFYTTRNIHQNNNYEPREKQSIVGSNCADM